MLTTIPEALFFAGGAIFASALLVIAVQAKKPLPKGVSPFGILALAIFSVLSVVTVMREGPLGFFREHTGTLWSSQIWFDLLTAATIGWTLLAPRARSVGMNLWVWGLALPLLGSMALLAMFLRVRALEAQRENGHAAHS
ncbi:MAG: hypothetical protein U0174_22475 [Polyangiaceae bacterium]